MITLPLDFGGRGKTELWGEGTKILVTTRTDRIICPNTFQTENDYDSNSLKISYKTNTSNQQNEEDDRYNVIIIPIETILLIQIVTEENPCAKSLLKKS